MERRKFIIGAGALGAGLSTAIGTGAFTSVEAERSFDIGTAGDQSAYVSLEAAQSSNGGQYVSTNGGLLTVTLDSLNNDAVTRVEQLFTIQNEGSQAVNVYLEDASDAVSFVSSGSTIEGASNSVELTVGEQVVVGLVVDTLSNDVEQGSLIDTVTVHATADDPSPGATTGVAEFNRIVTGVTGDNGPRNFETLTGALEAATAGDSIGLDNGITIDEPIRVDTPGVTIAGMQGGTTITTGDVFDVPTAALRVTQPGVTIQDVTVATDLSDAASDTNVASGIRVEADGVTIANSAVNRNNATDSRQYGQPSIYMVNADGSVVTGNSVENGSIGVIESGNLVVSNNTIDTSSTEGIWLWDGGNISSNAVNGAPDDVRVANTEFDVVGNEVRNFNAGESGSRAVKFVQQPDGINGESDVREQLASLLSENDIDSALIDDQTGTKLTDDIDSGASFSGVQSAIDRATADGVATLDGDNFAVSEGPLTVTSSVRGLGGQPTIEYNGGYPDSPGLLVENDDLDISGVQFNLNGIGPDGSNDLKITGGQPLLQINGAGARVRNTEFRVVGRFDGGPGFADVVGRGSAAGADKIVFENIEVVRELEDGTIPANPAEGSSGQFWLSSANLFRDTEFNSHGEPRTFILRDSTFRGGVKIDAHPAADANQRIEIVDNTFENAPIGESIQPSGTGDIVIENNQFDYKMNLGQGGQVDNNAKFKFAAIPETVNGKTVSTAADVAGEVAAANNDAATLVLGNETATAGDYNEV